VESSDPPVLVGYRDHLLSYKLMTSQVVRCLLLQMLSGEDSGRERVKGVSGNFQIFTEQKQSWYPAKILILRHKLQDKQSE